MLLTALLELDPQSLLAVGAGQDIAAVDEFKLRRPQSEVRSVAGFPRSELPSGRRFEVGLLSGVVERLAADQARQLIGRLRDQYCDGVLLLVPPAHWSLEEYLALGFERRSRCAGDAARDLYWYHVDSYNPEREWNNPDSWANPENFRRYRW
jgi:hypothetical protein